MNHRLPGYFPENFLDQDGDISRSATVFTVSPDDPMSAFSVMRRLMRSPSTGTQAAPVPAPPLAETPQSPSSDDDFIDALF